eukprot:TRINITY_DN3236_c1_g5_i1.p1 TRINITY_DN3236_c1_g5~~TRINITY_DN3236_c1_g5_i1.p1  ORF type:complete len:237 (-),score=92.44 TRINITY_DN3236_c1_g5_i1:368-1033(-)
MADQENLIEYRKDFMRKLEVQNEIFFKIDEISKLRKELSELDEKLCPPGYNKGIWSLEEVQSLYDGHALFNEDIDLVNSCVRTRSSGAIHSMWKKIQSGEEPNYKKEPKDQTELESSQDDETLPISQKNKKDEKSKKQNKDKSKEKAKEISKEKEVTIDSKFSSSSVTVIETEKKDKDKSKKKKKDKDSKDSKKHKDTKESKDKDLKKKKSKEPKDSKKKK